MRAARCAFLLAALLSACANGFVPEGRSMGRVDSAQEAAADAAAFALLGAPITVLEVKSGIAREIWTGAYPSFVTGTPELDSLHERFLAKLDRPAWRVRITGAPREDQVWEELIIDEATGSLLFSQTANGIP